MNFPFFEIPDLKRASPISSAGSEHQRCATLKSSGVLQGRLLNVPLPNPSSMAQQYQAATPTTSSTGIGVNPGAVAIATSASACCAAGAAAGGATASGGCMAGGHPEDSGGENHGEAYHWDCSDWVRRSHNPLPNITEVPGSEVPDSSSFHSNESNESQCKQMYQSQSEFCFILLLVEEEEKRLSDNFNLQIDFSLFD